MSLGRGWGAYKVGIRRGEFHFYSMVALHFSQHSTHNDIFIFVLAGLPLSSMLALFHFAFPGGGRWIAKQDGWGAIKILNFALAKFFQKITAQNTSHWLYQMRMLSCGFRFICS